MKYLHAKLRFYFSQIPLRIIFLHIKGLKKSEIVRSRRFCCQLRSRRLNFFHLTFLRMKLLMRDWDPEVCEPRKKDAPCFEAQSVFSHMITKQSSSALESFLRILDGCIFSHIYPRFTHLQFVQCCFLFFLGIHIKLVDL